MKQNLGNQYYCGTLYYILSILRNNTNKTLSTQSKFQLSITLRWPDLSCVQHMGKKTKHISTSCIQYRTCLWGYIQISYQIIPSVSLLSVVFSVSGVPGAVVVVVVVVVGALWWGLVWGVVVGEAVPMPADASDANSSSSCAKLTRGKGIESSLLFSHLLIQCKKHLHL